MVEFSSIYEENSARPRPERLVLSHLRQFGATARADLARQLGLSPATVSAATAALAARGVLREVADDAVPPQTMPVRNLRGRPSVRLDFALDAGTVASLRVGYARVELALADAQGSLRDPVVEDLVLRGHSAGEVSAALAAFVDRALATLHAPRIDALAVAFQGFVDAERGVVVWSPVLDCRDVALAAALHAHLGCPVAVENDAGALALGLAWSNRRYARGRTAAILLGEGVGLGLLFDGKLYRGVRAGGSEYGHIRIGAHGPQCRCGARGCIEASIADYALYRDVRLALGTPAAAPADEAEMVELVALAAAGNARAAAVFDGAAQVLAEGVSILLQLLQPENVVVAGPGVRARALLEPALRRHLAQLATPGILEHTTVEFADFDITQFLAGALRRGLEMLDDSLAARSP
jgi:predicted NBD/HSP70 family sugar kinase